MLLSSTSVFADGVMPLGEVWKAIMGRGEHHQPVTEEVSDAAMLSKAEITPSAAALPTEAETLMGPAMNPVDLLNSDKYPGRQVLENATTSDPVRSELKTEKQLEDLEGIIAEDPEDVLFNQLPETTVVSMMGKAKPTAVEMPATN